MFHFVLVTTVKCITKYLLLQTTSGLSLAQIYNLLFI